MASGFTVKAEDDSVIASGDYVEERGWYTLCVMLAMILFSFVDRQVLTLAAAPISVSLRLSDAQLGMLQGLAFAIFSTAGAYPIAWAADHYDRRVVLGACLLVWSLGTAACGFATSFSGLFVAAIAIAAGEAGLTPIVIASVPELFKGRKRQLANGLLYAFAYLGIAAGLAIGGSAIGAIDALHGQLPATLHVYEPWRLAFIAVALPTPLLLLLLFFARLDRGRTTPDAVVTATETRHFWRFLLDHRRAVTMVIGGMSLQTLAFVGSLIWLPVATTRLFATTPAQNGLGMGLAAAVGTILGVLAGTLVLRRLTVTLGEVAPIRFFWITVLCSIPIVLAFPLVTTAWQAFALFALLMLSSTAVGCTLLTVLQDMAPADVRARLFALWTMAAFVAGGTAPTLIGWASGSLGGGPRMLLISMSLVAAISWLASALILRFGEQSYRTLVRTVAAGSGRDG